MQDQVNKWTPGPWEDVGPNDEGERCIYGADNTVVAVTIPVGIPDENAARSIANARLIQAAPALLDTVESAYRMIFDEPVDMAILGEMLHRAIENARGDQ